MKNLELKELGVQELDTKEAIYLNGGNIVPIPPAGPIVNLLNTIFLVVENILNSVFKLVQGL